MNKYCLNISVETMFINTEKNETNEPDNLVLNLSQRLGLRSLNEHVDLLNLSIYCTWKNYKKTV